MIQAQFRIRVSSDSTTTSPPETLAVHDETQTQVVYYETPFYDVYILQRFAEGEVSSVVRRNIFMYSGVTGQIMPR